jgi:peptidyl-prolyl cis-trans isomerase SurA
MIYRIISIVLLAALLVLNACSANSELIVAEYGKYNISLNDFEKAYAKNTGSIEKAREDSISDYKRFLDLYVNFKMKLRNAEVRDYPNDPALKAELEDYKNKVGVSFYKEKEIITPALKKFYDMRKYELRVSHLMIRTDKLSKDAAKQKADSLVQRIKNGESFEELTAKYSEDKFSKDIGGDIYWITAGQIIPNFEKAAYATEVGQVYPEPVETRYGYHIIKVTDKQERRNSIRASHILINYTDDSNQPDTAAALSLAKEIKDKLTAGEDFAKLAEEFSEDKGTAPKGGDLGFFDRRQMVKEFDSTAFSLAKDQISDIVKTRFGFHIIKLTGEKPYPSFEEGKTELKALYEKTYFNEDYKKVIDDLKKEMDFKINKGFIDYAASNYDTVKFTNDYKSAVYYKNLKDSTVFNIANNPISFDSLLANTISSNKVKNKKLSEDVLKAAIDEYSEALALDEKAKSLDKENAEFASLMDDYRNGIFIFKLQEEEVWNKIDIDSTDLKNFYEDTKENYIWPNRVSFSEIHSRKDSLIKLYYSELQNGADFDSLAGKYTERAGFKNKFGVHELANADANELTKIVYELNPEDKYSEPVKISSGWSIFRINEKLPSSIKTFEEARAEAASAFQEKESKRLEDEFVNLLKSIYEPKVDYEILEKAFKTRSN